MADTVSTLAFQIVADTTGFTSGITATKKELREATKIMEAAELPTKKFAGEVGGLNDLYRKGLINQDAYVGSLGRLIGEYGAGIPVVGKFGNILAAGNPLLIAASVAAAAGAAAMAGLSSAIALVNEKTHEQFEVMDNIGNASENLGITAAAFQEIAGAAHIADIEFANVQTGLETLLVGISKGAKGDKKFAPLFEQLGLDPAALKDVGIDEALKTVIAAIENVSSHADRAAIAKRLFGNVDFLRLSVDGIAEASKLIEDLEATLTEVDGISYDEMEKSWKELQVVIDSIWLRVATDLLPGFTDLAKSLQEILIDLAKDQTLTIVIGEVADTFRGLVSLVPALKQAFDDLADSRGIKVLSDLTVGMSPLLQLLIATQSELSEMGDLMGKVDKFAASLPKKGDSKAATQLSVVVEDDAITEMSEAAKKFADQVAASDMRNDQQRVEAERRREAEDIFGDADAMRDAEKKKRREDEKMQEDMIRQLNEPADFRNPAAISGSQAELQIFANQKADVDRNEEMVKLLDEIAKNTAKDEDLRTFQDFLQ